MKPIKITLANRAAIDAALDAVNGKALTHTADAIHVFQLAKQAEEKVLGLLGSKKAAIGTKVFWRSGSVLPNAYKYSRRVTGLYIQRKSKDWWLISAISQDAWAETGKIIIIFTQEQDQIAKEKFANQYHVLTTLTT